MDIRPSSTPAVSQDLFTVYDNAGSPATDDGYLKLALRLDIPQAPRLIVAKADSQDPIFEFSNNFSLLLMPQYQYGAGSITLPNATIIAQPRLRVMYLGYVNEQEKTGIFVYNGGGLGNHLTFEGVNQEKYPIFDLGAYADMWFPVSVNGTDGFKIPSLGVSGAVLTMNVWDARGVVYMHIDSGISVSDEEVYIDTVTSTLDEVLIQGSGSGITVPGTALAGSQGNPGNQFWLSIYYKASAPVGERLQHNGGGGMIPLDVPYQLFGTNELVLVKYNANASTEGKEVRYSAINNRLEADIDANNTFSQSLVQRPNEVTKG